MAEPKTAATPTLDPDAPLVAAHVKGDKGKLLLTLDCRGLHAYLRQLGVGENPQYNNQLESAPNTGGQLIDANKHTVTPLALCMLDRSKTGAERSVTTIDLTQFYNVPPTVDTLQFLANSIRPAYDAVIAHYRPVEIKITVKGKSVAVTPATAE